MEKLNFFFVGIALNAERTLDSLLYYLNKQTYPHDLIEDILVDEIMELSRRAVA